jgi:hypothetical protein
VEPGLYVTFFTQGEPIGGELPPVGPLEHLVVRDRSLVAERKGGEGDLFVARGRWVEAEQEFRRATGKEPGGVKRQDLRIAGPEGVYLRFVAFGETAEDDPVPELGPYAVVVVGPRSVEADGDPLAVRTGDAKNLWELTGVGGSALVGVIRPDIAFRTRSTTYHAEVAPFRAGAKPASPARATEPRASEDSGLTLLERIGSEPVAARSTYAVATAADQREWGGAAWQLRNLIIGALVVLIVVFSVPSIRSFLSDGGPTSNTVNVGTAVTSAQWSYTVGTVRRVSSVGASQARGTYVVVQLAATNRGTQGAQLEPSSFALAAASGERYSAQPTTSVVYSSAENPDSSYLWPTEFPVGRAVIVPLVFEVNPAISGTQLLILDVPTTRVRLE